LAGDSISTGVSRRPKILSAPTMALCITAYFAERSRIGRKKRCVYAMNATSTPKLTVPARIALPPQKTRAASAMDPTSSTPA
jgi:hypothetical protein